MADIPYALSLEQAQQIQEASKADTIQRVAEETTRAQGIEAQIQESVTAETTRATTEEGTIQKSVSDEVTRATTAEQALTEKIDAEIRRATNAENLISGGHSTDLSTLNARIDSVAESVTTEANRAQDAENTLSQKDAAIEESVSDEVTRATAAEADLDTQVKAVDRRCDIISDASTGNKNKIEKLTSDLAAEVTRATTEEGNLDTKIQTQATRIDTLATSADDIRKDLEASIAHVSGNLDSEIARASAAEQKVSDDLGKEVSRAQAAEKANADAISANSATLQAGITKNASDLNAEISRASDAEHALDGKISDETTRATTAEEALGTRIDAVNQAITSATTDLEEKISDEVGRATAAEEANAGNITAEVTRAKAAETGLQEAITNEAKRASDAEKELDGKIGLEISRAQEAENAIQTTLSDSIQQEVETRTSQNTAIQASITELSDRVNSNNQAVSGSLDTLTADVASQKTKVENLEKSSITGYQVKPEDDPAAFSLYATNAAGESVNVIKVAHDPTDPSNPNSALINQKYMKALTESLNSQISSTNAAIQAEVTRATGVEGLMNGDLTNAKTDIAKIKIDLSQVTTTLESTTEKATSNAAAISDEVTRAMEMENDLQGQLTDVLAKILPPEFFQDESNIITKVDYSHPTGALFQLDIERTSTKDGGVEDNHITVKSSDSTISLVEGEDDELNYHTINLTVAGLKDKLDSTAFNDHSVLVEYTITPVSNVPVEGQSKVEYGYTWHITQKKFDPNTGTVSEETTTLDIFQQSGVEHVQDELYDEIARAKLAEEGLDTRVTTLEGKTDPSPKTISYPNGNSDIVVTLDAETLPLYVIYYKDGTAWKSDPSAEVTVSGTTMNIHFTTPHADEVKVVLF